MKKLLKTLGKILVMPLVFIGKLLIEIFMTIDFTMEYLITTKNAIIEGSGFKHLSVKEAIGMILCAPIAIPMFFLAGVVYVILVCGVTLIDKITI